MNLEFISFENFKKGCQELTFIDDFYNKIQNEFCYVSENGGICFGTDRRLGSLIIDNYYQEIINNVANVEILADIYKKIINQEIENYLENII